MKHTLTFNQSTVTSTESKINVEALDKSREKFTDKMYLNSFHLLLDYINPEIRSKYGNESGTKFSIPHGSIVINIELTETELKIVAPFLSMPEKGKIALMRQIAGLNTGTLNLSKIVLREDKLYFEYSCPIELVNPNKIFFILNEICTNGDMYDDEFCTKFKAMRIYEPKIKTYDDQTMSNIYDAIQLSCSECMTAVEAFEADRKFGHAWNIIGTTLYKILYFANPQGQLLNKLDEIISDHGREDVPITEILSSSKEFIIELQKMTKEELAESLYSVEIFISTKRRSNLSNIQSNFEDTFEKASGSYDADLYMDCCLIIVYKLYEMYYYNDVQDDVNAVISKALADSSAKPWHEAAEILHTAMENIMDGDLDIESNDIQYDVNALISKAFTDSSVKQFSETAEILNAAMGNMMIGNLDVESNDAQYDVNALISKAFADSSAKQFNDAAEILNATMKNIMNGSLNVESSDEK